jgi:hypothetical protein
MGRVSLFGTHFGVLRFDEAKGAGGMPPSSAARRGVLYLWLVLIKSCRWRQGGWQLWSRRFTHAERVAAFGARL